MGMNRKTICYGILTIWMLASNLQAQDINRYVVFFPDKSNSEYSIEHPEEFLSQRAINRRINQNIAINESDIPVNAWYLDSLRKYNLEVFFTSKWLNAAIVQCSVDQLSLIHDKDFVTSFEFVAPGAKLTNNGSPENLERGSIIPEGISADSYQQLAMLNVHTMHQNGYAGTGISVAVFDAGFDAVNTSAVFKHLFDDNRIKDVYDFVTNGKNVYQYDDHGTNVLSCLAGNYETTLIGPAYGADISLYVTEEHRYDDEYRVEEYNWLFAAERADSSGVDIISSSLGYGLFSDEEPNMHYSYEDTDGKTAIISRAAQFASDKGILVVSSAGNEGDYPWKHITMPSDVDDVLVVGSVSNFNKVASSSSRGPTVDGRIKPDVVAMGVSTTVYHSSNMIGSNSGTSFSAPLIAGLAAGLWEQYPGLTNLELKELIMDSGDHAHNPNNNIGHGLPDYVVATTGDRILSVNDVFNDKVSVYPNPHTGNHVFVKIERKFAKAGLSFNLYDPSGKLVNRTSFNSVKAGEVLELDVSSQSRGIFVLQIASASVTKNVRLLRY